MKKVAAAVIEQDGRYLITRRWGEGDPLAGLWEFPGGKVEDSESPKECLKREIYEELSVNVDIGEFICTSNFEYEHIDIQLIAFHAEWVDGGIRLVDHDAFAWVAPDEFDRYEMAPADIPIIMALQ